MKAFRYFAPLVSVLLAASAHAQFTFHQFIKEVDSTNDRVLATYDVPASGSQFSLSRMTNNGIRFELWADAIHPWDTQSLYQVDSKVVAPYFPQGQVTVTTLDMSNTLTSAVRTRTRADKPYTVRVKVSGMRSDYNDPDPEKNRHYDMDLVRSYQFKDPATNNYSPDEHVVQTYQIVANTPPEGNLYSDIVSVVPTPPFGYGEEFWRLKTHGTTETGTSLGTEVVGQATAYILPMSSVTWEGIGDGETLGPNDIDRVFTVHIHDIYPYSTTWVQIYPGPQRNGTLGTVLYEYTVKDQVGTFTYARDYAKRVADVVPTDGVYTIEVLTQLKDAYGTPPEIIPGGVRTFNFEMKMRINTGVDTVK